MVAALVPNRVGSTCGSEQLRPGSLRNNIRPQPRQTDLEHFNSTSQLRNISSGDQVRVLSLISAAMSVILCTGQYRTPSRPPVVANLRS